jgi:hypothetical protein
MLFALPRTLALTLVATVVLLALDTAFPAIAAPMRGPVVTTGEAKARERKATCYRAMVYASGHGSPLLQQLESGQKMAL